MLSIFTWELSELKKKAITRMNNGFTTLDEKHMAIQIYMYAFV